jgi:LysM repeat protein
MKRAIEISVSAAYSTSKERTSMKKILLALCIAILLFPHFASAQYYVEKGDSMGKIAKEQGMSLGDLISLNPHIENPNIIKPGDYIVIRSKVEKQKDLVDYARSLQESTTYVWGGQDYTPPMKTDCSGFVQAIYKKFGVNLPRVSYEQAKMGKPVKFKDLQIGDLMFFSTRADHKITHVGIFMGTEANTWISNLNAKKDVQILSTWGKWSQAYFQWGARFEL